MEEPELLITILKAEIERLNIRLEELTASTPNEQLTTDPDNTTLFQLLKTISDTVPDLVWVKDTQKRFVYTNKAICEKLLKATDTLEPVGKTDMFFAERERALFPGKSDWHTFGELCQDSDEIVLRTRKPGRFDEYGNVRGKILYLDVIKTPLFNAQGEIIGTIGTGRDVTKQRLIDIELKEYKENLERGESAALIMKALIASDGRLLKASDGICRYFDIPANTAFTASLYDVLHPDDIETFKEGILKIETRETETIEAPIRFRLQNGKLLYAMYYLSAVYASEPKPIYYLLYLRDTTKEVESAEVILEQQQSYGSLLQSLPTGVVIYRPDRSVVAINAAACELFGCSGENTQQLHIDDLFADKESLALLELRNADRTELTLLHSDGTAFAAEVYIRPEEGSDRSLFIVQDISDRKLQEHKILEGLELYRTLFRVSTNGILLIDKEGYILDANEANLELLGYTYNELVGQHISFIVPIHLHPVIRQNIERILSGEVLRQRVESRKKNGEEVIVQLTESKIITPSGDECILSISMDLTETEKAAASLRESEERYRAFIQNASEGIYRLDVYPPIPTWLPAMEQNNLLYERASVAEANNAIARMYGLRNGNDLVGKTYTELHGGNDNPENINTNLLFINNGYQILDALTEETDVHGIRKYFSNNVVGTVENNHLTAIWGTQVDVTEIKKAAGDLEKSERRFRTVFNNAALGVLLLSPAFTVLEYNDAFAKLFSLQKDSQPEIYYPDLLHPNDRHLLAELFKAAGGDKAPLFELKILSGTEIKYTRQYTTLIYNEAGIVEYAVVLVDDITEQIIAAREVNRLQALVQGAAKSGSVLLTVSNVDTAVNTALAILGEATRADRVYIFQNDVSEFGNPKLTQRYEWCSPGIIPQIDNPDLQGLSYTDAGFERWFAALDEGQCINGAVHTFPLSEQDILLEQGIKSLVVVPIFIQKTFWGFIGFDDCTYGRIWLPEEVNALESVAASFGGAIHRDEVNRELIKAKSIAESSSKVQSALFINLNHELRTPMNAILGFSDVLYSEAESEQQKKWAFEVCTSAKRLMQTLTELIEYAQFESGNMEVQPIPVQLNNAIKGALHNHTQTAAYKGIKLITASGYDFTVKGEDTLLQRLFEALISNAIKFTSQGSVTVTALRVMLNDLPFVKIDITDTGVGIKPEDIQKIFAPFRQASEGMGRQYEGSGLGLSLSKKIVTLFEGKLEVHSRPGKGTTVSVFLPEVSDRTDRKSLPVQRSDGRRLSVLFVEDNEHNIHLFKRYLVPAHDVIFAENGEAALKCAAEKKYDIIMMDIGLPGELNGVDVFKIIRGNEGPNRLTPVVAVTGYTTHADKQKLMGYGFDDFIAKPVELTELNRIFSREFATTGISRE